MREGSTYKGGVSSGGGSPLEIEDREVVEKDSSVEQERKRGVG